MKLKSKPISWDSLFRVLNVFSTLISSFALQLFRLTRVISGNMKQGSFSSMDNTISCDTGHVIDHTPCYDR